MSRGKSGVLVKILTGLLYSLPILFFVICYFVIITSGEDIFQGANSPINIIDDALAAFRHSARLSDMYAWAVINFFDYQYSFGVDTIFRLIDVALAGGIFYMATFIVLKRRPKLRLKDALIFCTIFLLVLLTSNGLALYAGFSKIHNYLLIGFFSLLFGLIYLRDIWGSKTSRSLPFALLMLVLGFLFGFMSNVTGIVFLLALVAYVVYLRIRKQKIHWKKFICSWRLMGVIGVLIGLGVIYILGNGLGDYTKDAVYLASCDYVTLEQLFNDFIPSVMRIGKHTFFNFSKFFLPFLAVGVPIVIAWFVMRRKKLVKLHKMPRKDQNFVIGSTIFVVLHLLAVSQIYYPTRLILPAYLVAVCIFVILVRWLFADVKVKMPIMIWAWVCVGLCVGLIVVRSYFAISYIGKVAPVLDEIKNSNESVLCVEKSVARAPFIPYIHLNQEDFLIDWAMPETIYQKKINFCDSQR